MERKNLRSEFPEIKDQEEIEHEQKYKSFWDVGIYQILAAVAVFSGITFWIMYQ